MEVEKDIGCSNFFASKSTNEDGNDGGSIQPSSPSLLPSSSSPPSSPSVSSNSSS